MRSPSHAPEHIPALAQELVQGLHVIPGGLYVDCTAGGGGHAEAVLGASAPGGRLLGIDADPQAIRAAQRRLQRFQGDILLVNDNFANLQEIAERHGFGRVHGVYFDLGLSTLQLEEPGRGFSFQREDPLDMRLSDRQRRTAADLVNDSPLEELAQVLRSYGEERRSRAIARRIVAERPIQTTGQLARLVQRAAPFPGGRIHPATRTFQALRIWANDELANLERALRQTLRIMAPGGRIAAISYHSLEDRAVKTLFKQESTDCICPPGIPICSCGHKATLRILTRKVIVPSAGEIERNPRSRSARLRIAEML